MWGLGAVERPDQYRAERKLRGNKYTGDAIAVRYATVTAWFRARQASRVRRSP